MRELAYATRKLVKAPLFTVVAVLCLALGVGANTAIFSVVNTILLRPLPFNEVDRLIFLSDVFESNENRRVGVSALNFTTLNERNQVFESMGAVVRGDFSLTGDGEAEYLEGARTTWDWLPTLGFDTVRGRTYTAEEDLPGQPAPVVVISYSLWQRRYGGEDVIGRNIVLDDRTHEIIGILEDDAQFPYQAELWLPLGLDPNDPTQRDNHFLGAFGLLEPGVSLERMEDDLDRVYRQLAEEFPQSNEGWSAVYQLMRDELLRGIQPRLYMLFAAVGFLLLIACANVANMTLARSQERLGELTIRLALGASRWVLVRQLLIESVLVALLGGALGIGLAYLCLGPLIVLSPIATMNTFYQDISIDWRVLLFTFGISVLVGVLFGLVPALRATRPDLQSTLRDAGQRAGTGIKGRRLLAALVVFEIALAVVLLVGAGLTVDSLRRLQAIDAGFPTEDLLSLRFNLPERRYPDPGDRLNLMENLLRQVESLPEADSAAVGGALPLATLLSDRRLGAATIEGRPLQSENDFVIFNHRLVSPGYLETLGIPLTSGRYLAEADHRDAMPVVVVSRQAERLYWPEGAVGKRVKRGRPSSENPWMTIVGVVEDVADHDLGTPASETGPTWYLPYTQHDFRRLSVVVRTKVPSSMLVRPIKDLTAALDPDLPLYGVESMEDRLATSYRAKKFVAMLLTFFGVLGVVLAGIGIYGVMSYVVSQQRRDIGIRMAMGAASREVLVFVLKRGMILATLGVVIGLVVAAVSSRALVRVYPTIDPGHFSTYVVMAAGLLVLALVACYVPARRATRVDPIKVLREE